MATQENSQGYETWRKLQSALSIIQVTARSLDLSDVEESATKMALESAADLLDEAMTELDQTKVFDEPDATAVPGTEAADDGEEDEAESYSELRARIDRQKDKLIAEIVEAVCAQSARRSDAAATDVPEGLLWNHWSEHLHRAAGSTRNASNGYYNLPREHYMAAVDLLERLALECLSPASESAQIEYDRRRCEVWERARLSETELRHIEKRFIASIGLDHFPATASEFFAQMLEKIASIADALHERRLAKSPPGAA